MYSNLANSSTSWNFICPGNNHITKISQVRQKKIPPLTPSTKFHHVIRITLKM